LIKINLNIKFIIFFYKKNMQNYIYCQKLKKKLPALDIAPYPGNLGKKILKHISSKAWEMWKNQQTILINEYRLNMLDKESRLFLLKKMNIFLFGEYKK